MHRGYIKLWRKYQDNEFWKERREFSKAEAWLDILMQVQHSKEPQFISLGMSVVECKQGQAIKSLDTWAQRWNWHKSKVRRFMHLLQKRTMIDTEALPQTTRITVLGYETYNETRHSNETEMKHKRNGDETHSTPDKNVETVKNVENEITPLPPKGGGHRSKLNRLTQEQKKRIKVTANTNAMIGIGKWFGRKPTTLWTLYEAEALAELLPLDMEEVAALKAYYTATIPKEQDYRRRDIAQLLNNWQGEVDRARKHDNDDGEGYRL